jgi:hypothetical protein
VTSVALDTVVWCVSPCSFNRIIDCYIIVRERFSSQQRSMTVESDTEQKSLEHVHQASRSLRSTTIFLAPSLTEQIAACMCCGHVTKCMRFSTPLLLLLLTSSNNLSTYVHLSTIRNLGLSIRFLPCILDLDLLLISLLRCLPEQADLPGNKDALVGIGYQSFIIATALEI